MDIFFFFLGVKEYNLNILFVGEKNLYYGEGCDVFYMNILVVYLFIINNYLNVKFFF